MPLPIRAAFENSPFRHVFAPFLQVIIGVPMASENVRHFECIESIIYCGSRAIDK